jgi:hypothetical protein
MVFLHADAIAEEGAPGERAAWVYRKNGNGFPIHSQGASQRVDESAFARSGRPGNADRDGSPGPGKKIPQQLAAAFAIGFDKARGARESA